MSSRVFSAWRRRCISLCLFLPICTVLSARARSQDQSQEQVCTGPAQPIIGVLADPSNAAIPYVTVRAQCGATVHATTTDGQGIYRLLLAPGPWQIRVESPGFQKTSLPLTVVEGARNELRTTLQLAHDNSVVTVVADVGMVNTATESTSKIDTPVLEQPFSIVSVTQTQLQQQNVQSLNQALKYTAGASPEMYGPDPRGDWFTIRGNPADVYLDGVRVPQAVNSPNSFAAIQLDPNDLSRFELLLGPSSALYGQSNIGGLVDGISKRPSLTPRRNVQLQGGNFDRIQGGGDFSGPLNRSASLLYSVNGIARSSHTYVYGARDDRFTFNPTLEWKPSLNTSVSLFGKFLHGDVGTAAVFLPRAGTLDRSPAFGYLPTWFNSGDPATDRYRKRQYMTGYAIEHNSPQWNLRHMARYVHANIVYAGLYAGAFSGRYIYRVNFVSKPVIDGFQTDTHASKHLITGRFRHLLLGGADFQWQQYKNRQGGVLDTSLALDVLNPVYGVKYTPTPITTLTDAKQFQGGAYGQEQVQVAGFTVVAGGRYDQTAQETLTVTTGATAQQRPHAFTGHAGISYQRDGLAPYVSYSTSFLPTIGQGFDDRSFVPTTGASYEAGVKYQLPRHIGMVTFAAYSMTQDNRTTTDPDHPLFSRQIGQVRTIGHEMQASGTVMRSLDLSFSYAHTRPVVTRSTTADYHKLLAPISKDAVSLWAHYTVRRTLLTGFGFGGGARYLGPKWGDAANTFETPGYTVFDGTLDYTLERWRFAINSTNLLNKRYVAACSTLTNCYYGGTRSAIASVNFSF
jgi:iron complex outermembrane receptor protein